MTDSAQSLSNLLTERFGDRLLSCDQRIGEVAVEVAATNLLGVCRQLRDDQDLCFSLLIDLCGVDYSSYGQAEWQTSEAASSGGFSRGVERDGLGIAAESGRSRFAVVMHLLSVENNQRLRLRVPLADDPPRLASVVEIWSGADWYEREAFDLYGILFEGHPDLRRILTDYGFVGHPFRKDFPLVGHVEMRYDSAKQRVVYEPVSIEPRTLVPRVIRQDHRYLDEDAAQDVKDA